MSIPKERLFTCWALLEPAEDVAGQWTGHCLDVDVVTQGSSAEHAFEMVCEAVGIVLSDDMQAGREPLLRRAPAELWAPLWRVVQSGEKSQNLQDAWGELPDGAVRIAVCFVIAAARPAEADPPRRCPRPKLVCSAPSGGIQP